MPYLSCPGCRLTVYSAAAHSTVEPCPCCGAGLFVDSAHRRLDATRRELHRRAEGEEAIHGHR
jgi:hypothetical protein